jgi:hypothetical protein
MIGKASRRSSHVLSLLALLLVCCRIENLDYIYNSLWAEDGNIFIKQAYELGLTSILSPYQGYLHFYPRVVAWMTTLLPISITPLLFFVGWCWAFYYMAYIICESARKYSLGIVWSTFLIIFIAIQPAGETLYTLTNGQWYLAVALTLILLVPRPGEQRWLAKIWLMSICLTGPFVVIIAPFLFLRGVLYRDFYSRSWVYLLVAACAMTQLIFLLSSERVGSGISSASLSDMISAAVVFLTFGSSSDIISGAAWLVWLVFLISFINSYRSSSPFGIRQLFSFGLIGLAGVAVFLAAVFSLTGGLGSISPVAAGGRYYLVPYTLLLVAIFFVVTNNKVMCAIVCGCFLIIFSQQKGVLWRSNLQYSAFVELSKYAEGVDIPINPQWGTYPGWHFLSNGLVDAGDVDKFSREILNLTELVGSMGLIEGTSLTINVTSTDPQIQIPLNSYCTDSKYIGLRVEIHRENEGWGQIFWGVGDGFSEKNSLKRYYPSGHVTMDFAVEPKASLRQLRFDPSGKIGKIVIHDATLYCMHGNSKQI